MIPNDLGDPILNAWIVWWNVHALPFTTAWWNALAFWPSTGALAFSEVLLGLAPITTPIQWLGGGPIAAYNVAFLLTFPLSALAAHALVHRLTGRHLAALIGGLVYGFNPFRIAHFPQIQVMSSYWMPLALLGLHAYVGRQERRWLVLFGVAWLMQSLSNGYYLLFFPVLLALDAAVHFRGRRSDLWRHGHRVGRLLMPWFRCCGRIGGFTPRSVARCWRGQRVGADVTSLLDASPLLKF